MDRGQDTERPVLLQSRSLGRWIVAGTESRLPVNFDPLDSKLTSREERQRIARLFNQGLDRVTGYVLPLRWWGFGTQGGWKSGR